ncbi:MAG: FtsX-like permease family protein [Verrucomicrobiota bacterium]
MLPFSYAVRNLFRDPVKFLQKVGGGALVVFLIFSAAAFNRGMEEILKASGSENNVILLGAGSEESVERSEIPVQAVEQAVAGIRGIEKRLGVPAASGEVHYMGNLFVAEDTKVQGLIRGILPEAFEVHREVRLIEGRYPGPGEILMGRVATHTLGIPESLVEVGRKVEFEGQDFTISGRFEAPGTVMESEVWMDRNDLMTLIQRDTLSCVVIRQESPDFFAAADLFTKQRLDLELVATRESDYYKKLSQFYGPIRVMTWVTAGLVAAGAVFGGLNLLYASFSARIREMATLQAVGYSRLAILWSLIQESLLATLLGTLIAAFLAVGILQGVKVPFSVGTFELALTAPVILLGLGTGILLGLTGALPPAWRCLSAPLPVALRSS